MTPNPIPPEADPTGAGGAPPQLPLSGPFTASEAAQLLAVGEGTIADWASSGALTEVVEGSEAPLIDPESLAAAALSHPPVLPLRTMATSARNRFVGIVVDVRSDTVMSQVVLRCGPYQVFALVSTDSVRRLDLRPGRLATAVVKATSVMVEDLESLPPA